MSRHTVLALAALLCTDPSARAAAEQDFTMPHVALLGDSVFDNAAYVRGNPDVIIQLRGALPAGWQASLVAVDGHVTRDVVTQLQRLPGGTSHLVISVGGNDALRASGVLERPTQSVSEALGLLAEVREHFRAAYREMLDAAQARGLPTAICTIYDPRYPDPKRRRLTTTALSLLNDIITREAFARGLPLIDLRVLCDEDADFANPIEPSARGGQKIAEAIAALMSLDPGTWRGRVLARPAASQPQAAP
ncbi:SGNH/GDSL hydrolase family protein [Methylobacterium gregans]